MFVETDFESALALIEFESIFLDWSLVPAEFPFAANSPYREGYDWLFIAEKKVMQAAPTWLRELRFELIGEKGVLSEALSNAFCHAHRRQERLPIQITGYLGRAGLMISVRDQGPGFDFQELLKRVHQGKKYYQNAGNGLQWMEASKNINIFYDLNGMRCNMYRLLKK